MNPHKNVVRQAVTSNPSFDNFGDRNANLYPTNCKYMPMVGDARGKRKIGVSWPEKRFSTHQMSINGPKDGIFIDQRVENAPVIQRNVLNTQGNNPAFPTKQKNYAADGLSYFPTPGNFGPVTNNLNRRPADMGLKSNSTKNTDSHLGNKSNYNFKRTSASENYKKAVNNRSQAKRYTNTNERRANFTDKSLKVITISIRDLKNSAQSVSFPFIVELFGQLDSVLSAKEQKMYKYYEFTLKDSSYESIKCRFHPIDRELSRLIRGQWHRCVGKMGEDGYFSCQSIRPANPAELKHREEIKKISRATSQEIYNES